MAADGRRVELVEDGDRSPGLPSTIGVGLLGSLVVGFGPLRDAAQGNGPFEAAMTRYLACLLVCLAGASVVGRILDSAPPEANPEPGGKGEGNGAGSGQATGTGDGDPTQSAAPTSGGTRGAAANGSRPSAPDHRRP